MMCEVCGKEGFKEQRVDRTFHVNGKIMLVESIPAQVCVHCGEANFDAHVAERIRRIAHGPHTPSRIVQAEVLNYDAA